MKRNPRFNALAEGYLFPEVTKRSRAFQASHPEAKLISLGIGNTTEPLTPHIVEGLRDEVERLGTAEGYSGYGDDQGLPQLRERIAAFAYKGSLSADEIFISDGAKCDIGRLQALFGACKAAIQDPAYPVYVDGCTLQGAKISFMPCTKENGFIPDPDRIPKGSVVYFCSPNNPTGAVANREQLSAFVQTAIKRSAIIIFDAAYSEYITDPNLPKSIFEIDGAKECAIEVNSFSKPIGFTGVRLGWTAISKELKYVGGKYVHTDWLRINTTLFNGASNISSHGGLASFDPVGRQEMAGLVGYYKQNALIIKKALEELGVECEGGINAPYIWGRFPGRDSWDVFAELLEKCNVIATPGSGFGPSGQSYIRFSSFGHRKNIEEGAGRLKNLGKIGK
jgi:LL-diaminopimelate aminotransferase